MLKLLSMLNVRVSTSSVYMASWQAKSQAQVERVERVERVEPGPENLFGFGKVGKTVIFWFVWIRIN